MLCIISAMAAAQRDYPISRAMAFRLSLFYAQWILPPVFLVVALSRNILQSLLNNVATANTVSMALAILVILLTIFIIWNRVLKIAITLDEGEATITVRNFWRTTRFPASNLIDVQDVSYSPLGWPLINGGADTRLLAINFKINQMTAETVRVVSSLRFSRSAADNQSSDHLRASLIEFRSGNGNTPA